MQVEGLGVAGKAHITITHAYTNFGVFGPLGGQKSDFQKIVKKPLDVHMNNICTNFQLYKSFYNFRKIVKYAFRGLYEQCLYRFSAS